MNYHIILFNNWILLLKDDKDHHYWHHDLADYIGRVYSKHVEGVDANIALDEKLIFVMKEI